MRLTPLKFNEQCRLSPSVHRYECVVGGVVVGRFSNTKTAARTACWNAYLHNTRDVMVRDRLTIEMLNYHDCMIAVGKADLELEEDAARQSMRGRWRANA